MKKTLKFSLLFAAIVTLTSCSKETYVVTFDSQGGTSVAAITAKEGKKIAKPTDPTKAKFDFAGWYKEVSCTNAWNFEKDAVNTNIILYAKWEPQPVNVELYYADYYGDFGVGTHNFEIAFMSDDETTGYVLDLNSPTATAVAGGYVLAEGTYNYDVQSTFAAFTIDDYYSFGVDIDAQANFYFVSGTVVVSKTGSNYKFDVNLLGEDGAPYVFVWQGAFVAENQQQQ